jgi:peroxiredoxin
MKRNYMFFYIMILSSSISFSQGKILLKEGYIVKVGDKAPDFTIKEAGGKSYKLSDLKGNVVMLQFTASWCSV